jgi:NADH:ubiquinone oxidoreductase subunit F (NADH-binding)
VTSNACEAPAVTESYHLLGHPIDLDGHVRVLGVLPMPIGPNQEWAQWLMAVLESSGLRGRGGAAFPTSIKLGVARAGGGGGILVVNGMESEPASDKDKMLLTRAPHLVLDGAQLLAAACAADQVIVCIPGGRDGVADAVSYAIGERRARSYSQIPEHVMRPPARFVAGEESALAQWLSSGLSLPSFRPEKSVALRIGKRPALVHNAETLAHVGLISRCGPASFRAHGPLEEPGTTLVTISGSVKHPGVIEIDRGTSLHDIVACSVPAGEIRAFLVGGYGGAWVGPEHFGMPYASSSLRTIGISAGVGIIVVLDGSGCGIAESARIARFMAGQSAGQCGPCVYGLPAIAEDLTLLAQGRAGSGLLPRLLHRLDEVDGRGACRHPDGVVGMVRSALQVFASDVAAHEAGSPCVHWNRATQLRLPREL